MTNMNSCSICFFCAFLKKQMLDGVSVIIFVFCSHPSSLDSGFNFPLALFLFCSFFFPFLKSFLVHDVLLVQEFKQ